MAYHDSNIKIVMYYLLTQTCEGTYNENEQSYLGAFTSQNKSFASIRWKVPAL